MELTQQQLVARMVEALVEARATILLDRESLHGTVVCQDGTVDADSQPPLDEYDRVLELIGSALDSAKGGRPQGDPTDLPSNNEAHLVFSPTVEDLDDFPF